MRTRLIFLSAVLFLLSIFTANAESQINEDLNNSIIFYTTYDADRTADNSTFGNTGTIDDGNWIQTTRNPQVGDGSLGVEAGTAGTIIHSNIGAYKTIENFTVSCWNNETSIEGNDVVVAMVSSTPPFWYVLHDASPASNYFFFYRLASASEPTVSLNTDATAYEGTWHQWAFVFNDSNAAGGNAKVQGYLNGTLVGEATVSPSGSKAGEFTEDVTIGQGPTWATGFDDGIDECVIWNRSLTSVEIDHTYQLGRNGTTRKNVDPPPEDSTPPEINDNSYNMTSEGGAGCINWRTNKDNGCTTTDTTPTVTFTTNEDATCAIGVSNLNYNDFGATRECSGSGTTDQTCTLIVQDELAQEDSYIYIGCKDFSGNQNQTSTSGGLRISIHTSDLETIGRNAIESGIQNALGSEYTIYTDQKLYARNSANNQFVTTFDKVVKWLNKIWAFNILTGNDTATDAFNITPILYVLEMTNVTNSTVNSTVYQLILDTK
jgi:hypothetical protein